MNKLTKIVGSMALAFSLFGASTVAQSQEADAKVVKVTSSKAHLYVYTGKGKVKLNVRSSASKNSKIVGKLANGTGVYSYGQYYNTKQKHYFEKIKYKGKYRYVSSHYMVFDDFFVYNK